MKIFALYRPWIILALLISFLPACESSRQEVSLVIKTPVQEMNTISQPEVRDVATFLERASRDFAAKHTGAKVVPSVKSFNYVDEIKAVTGSFDTPQAPDILFGAFFNLSGYIYTGRVAPVDDILNPELKGDLDEFGLEMGARDGKIYMLPFLNMQNILIYNKQIFRQCGLQAYIGQGREIQNWTLPQWRAILDTLAEKLPRDKYPLAIFAKNNQGDTHIMSYMRAFGGKIFDANGNFDFEQPAIIKALAWLQEGVRRHWFPPHPETLEMKDCSELFANGQLAIYMFNNANRALYSDINNYGFVNYPGGISTTFYNGFVVFDNGDPAKLQAAKDFLAFLFATDQWRDLSAGNIPASRKTLEKYRDRITMINEFTANAANVVDFFNKSPNWQGRPDSVRSVFWKYINELLALKITPIQCAQELDRVCNWALKIGRASQKLHP